MGFGYRFEFVAQSLCLVLLPISGLACRPHAHSTAPREGRRRHPGIKVAWNLRRTLSGD